MYRVLVNGSSGKMGQEVVKLISQSSDFYLFGGIDKTIKEDANYVTYSSTEELPSTPDVIIDFSIPFASLSILHYACDKHVPIVIATTGFSQDEQDYIVSASKKTAIFQSANMSFDINVMKNVVASLAPVLSNDDIEIVETHHNNKLDAPSGTAIMLADSINKTCKNKYTYVFNRNNLRQKREKNEIGFSSIRGGNVVGKHSVIFFSDDESIEITHVSYSRAIYARGALKAAKFIADKQNGYYTMNDLFTI